MCKELWAKSFICLVVVEIIVLQIDAAANVRAEREWPSVVDLRRRYVCKPFSGCVCSPANSRSQLGVWFK